MIAGTDYAGRSCALIDSSTGRFVNAGDLRMDKTGQGVQIVGGQPPHKPSSTGRVHVQSANGFVGEFFPSVYGLKWEVYHE